MNQSEPFSYWKKPWHKWMVLGGAVLQMVALWLRIQDFIGVYQHKAALFSLSKWENYAHHQLMQFTLSGLLIIIFLGCFIIGFFARSNKSVHTSTGILLLFVTLVWGLAGFLMNAASQTSTMVLWGAILLVSLIGSIHALWESRRF